MIYAFLVFLSGCFYGILSTIVKFAYADGFSVGEVIGAHLFFGFMLQFLFVLLFSRKKVSLKQVGLLILVGTSMSATGILYNTSLVTIPASVAIILIFQYTWVGILIDAIASRKLPDKGKVFSVVLLLFGSVLAAGIVQGGFGELNVWGLILGLLSGVSYAIFIFVSGRVATEVPALNRTLFMALGAMIIVFICFPPTFIVNGALTAGLWKYGLLLGLFGVVISAFFMALGAPKVGPGLATILSSSELPVAVIASALVLKEAVSVLQWIGVIIVFIGIALPQMPYFKARNQLVPTSGSHK